MAYKGFIKRIFPVGEGFSVVFTLFFLAGILTVLGEFLHFPYHEWFLVAYMLLLYGGLAWEARQRRKAQRSLIRRERIFRAFTENIDDVVWVTNSTGDVLKYVSPSFEAVWGIKSADLYQNPMLWLEAIVAEDRVRIRREMVPAQAGERVMLRYRITRPDGEVRWICDHMVPVFNKAGEVYQITGIARDISARVRADTQREALFASQRNALVSELHHRMKNNLQGTLGLLERQKELSPELSLPLSRTMAQIQALAIAHGLIATDEDQRPQVCPMVESIIGNVQQLFGNRIPIAESCACVPHLRLLEGEAAGVALIINELLFNAVKHASDGKVNVAMGAGPGVESISIEVTNNGHLPEAFDFASGIGCGVGLRLIQALMPSRGINLEFSSAGNKVVTSLLLYPPVLELQQMKVA